MTNTMRELLTACVEGKGREDYVFTRANRKPVRDFRDTWHNACDRAGVPDLLFHDLRRTAARNLRRAGVPESMIEQIGGWKTTSVFHRYAIVNHQDMAAAMRQYEDHKCRVSRKSPEVESGHNLGTIEELQPSDTPSKKIQ